MDPLCDFYSNNYSLKKTSNILYPANNTYRNYKINDIDNLLNSYKFINLKDFVSPKTYDTLNISPFNYNKRYVSTKKENNIRTQYKNQNIQTIMNSIQALNQNQNEIISELKGLKEIKKKENYKKSNNHELLSTINKLKEDNDKMKKEILVLKNNDEKDKKIKQLEDLLENSKKENQELKKKLGEYQNENKEKEEKIKCLQNELEKIKLSNNNTKLTNANIFNSLSTDIIPNETIFNGNKLSTKK